MTIRNEKPKKKLTLTALAAVCAGMLSFGLASCEEDDPIDDATDAIEEGVDDAEDAVDDIGDGR